MNVPDAILLAPHQGGGEKEFGCTRVMTRCRGRTGGGLDQGRAGSYDTHSILGDCGYPPVQFRRRMSVRDPDSAAVVSVLHALPHQQEPLVPLPLRRLTIS